MTILEKIITKKRVEVAASKQAISLTALQSQPQFNRDIFSFSDALQRAGSSGVIAEFKRKSPSKGFINEHADAASITTGYTKAGAAALSVLTDAFFFGGSTEDLLAARNNAIPILRKDFIIDEYEIVEAKAMGADVILLIAACLTPLEVKQFTNFSHNLGMEVLLELHDVSELGHLYENVDVVGINNRNLKTFEVDVNLAIALSKLLPQHKPKIAESGIADVHTAANFLQEGYCGLLMGEAFMATSDPAAACQGFIASLQKLKNN